MNKIFLFLILAVCSLADECENLSLKYKAPDASKLRVVQVWHWIENNFNHIRDDAYKLELCMMKIAKDYNDTKELLENKGGESSSDDILKWYKYK